RGFASSGSASSSPRSLRRIAAPSYGIHSALRRCAHSSRIQTYHSSRRARAERSIRRTRSRVPCVRPDPRYVPLVGGASSWAWATGPSSSGCESERTGMTARALCSLSERNIVGLLRRRVIGRLLDARLVGRPREDVRLALLGPVGELGAEVEVVAAGP